MERKMKKKKIGLTIGKFAPLHKGHQFLIETAIQEMDEVYIVIYDTDIIENSVQERAKWIKKLYPNIHLLYAFNSPKQYGLDDVSVKIQMEYLLSIIKDIPITHFYSSELYGEKVAKYMHIENRVVDLERKNFSISSATIRENYQKNKQYLEDFIFYSIIT